MASVDLVVAAPAWDRAWSLPLWFESVRANCDPATTGLAFVVPAADALTRDAIGELSGGFAWVEVLRDRGEQSRREERPETRHETLAAARNQLLSFASRVRPAHYLSWDTDYLVAPDVVPVLRDLGLPLVTVWGWLNRQQPRRLRHFDGEYTEVFWQPPVCATAMAWEKGGEHAVHYPPAQFNDRASGLWRCGVALAFQLMDRRAYAVSAYAPHPDGEDVGFNRRLAQRGVPRYCYGDSVGVHLYDRGAKDEITMDWPDVMRLAEQRPLAATWTEPRSTEHVAFGFFPTRGALDADPRAA
jgi:hypothetical protein